MYDRQVALDLIRDIAPPATAEERTAIAQRVIDTRETFDATDAYALTIILCTARVCERDQAAQRAELLAVAKLAEIHDDLSEARYRLPTLERPVGDPVQDRLLAQLLDG